MWIGETYAWYDLFALRRNGSERYAGSVFYPETYGIPGNAGRIELLQIADKLGVAPPERLTCVSRTWDGYVEVWDTDEGAPVARLRRGVQPDQYDRGGEEAEQLCPRCGSRGTFVRMALKCVPCDVLLGGC